MSTWTLTQTFDVWAIQDLFIKADRNNFSTDALEVIMNMLEEQSEGEAIDLDIIAICCEYSEYDEYGLHDAYSHMMNGEEYEIEDLVAVLAENTYIQELSNGNYLVQAF